MFTKSEAACYGILNSAYLHNCVLFVYLMLEYMIKSLYMISNLYNRRQVVTYMSRNINIIADRINLLSSLANFV